jgi:hypothetical protein
MYFPTQAVAQGFRQLVVLQFEMVWSAANAERGLTNGPEVRAGVSHPDFGLKWSGLTVTVQHFLLVLHLFRLRHFEELSGNGDLDVLLRVGRGEIPLSEDLQLRVAERFHNDWWMTRQILYTFKTEDERQRMIDAGVRQPYGEHEGDKPWQDETPQQQENDLSLVKKWAWLLAFCEADQSELGELFKYIRR